MDEDEERWEDEGGATAKEWSDLTRAQKAGLIHHALSEYYPKIEYVEMDGSILWKSLEVPVHGEIIEYEGKHYRVLYGWHWIDYGPVPVYMAELEPLTLDPKPYVHECWDDGTCPYYGLRYDGRKKINDRFNPREGYSQNREDYP